MTPAEISNINKKFYNEIAAIYDSVDSRRNRGLDHEWIDPILHKLACLAKSSLPKESGKTIFLDAGAGSGFLAKRAHKYFSDIVLLDISEEMLKRIALPGAQRIVGDCNDIPIPSNSKDVVGAFATLHHLHSPELFFEEAHRVLKVGGYLYCDHDIESHFIQIFRLPLKVFRFFFDHAHKYLKLCPNLTTESYKLSEFHGENGLDGRTLSDSLRKAGFDIVEQEYHWDGMGLLGAFIAKSGLSKYLNRRGIAPIIRIIALKK